MCCQRAASGGFNSQVVRLLMPASTTKSQHTNTTHGACCGANGGRVTDHVARTALPTSSHLGLQHLHLECVAVPDLLRQHSQALLTGGAHQDHLVGTKLNLPTCNSTHAHQVADERVLHTAVAVNPAKGLAAEGHRHTASSGCRWVTSHLRPAAWHTDNGMRCGSALLSQPSPPACSCPCAQL